MSDLRARLKKKGWSDADIAHAIEIIEKSKAKKPENIKFLDSIVYWLVLFVALMGNFIISIILIPFMLTMQGIKLVIVICIIGFAFGSLFDLIIRDIRNLENKQVIIAGIFLPLLALINVSLMVNFSNYLQRTIGLENLQHNPIFISIIYVIAFVSPNIIKSILSLIESKNMIPSTIQKI